MTEEIHAAAVALGRKGGASTSEKKSRASRANLARARAARRTAENQPPAPVAAPQVSRAENRLPLLLIPEQK